jgi:hypothetical protein
MTVYSEPSVKVNRSAEGPEISCTVAISGKVSNAAHKKPKPKLAPGCE